LLLRVVASGLMLAVLLPRIHLGSVLPAWEPEAILWLGAALLTTAGAIVLSALRWQAVLTGLGLPARLRTLLHHYLAGMFVGNFLPSTIGGDVLRARRLALENGASADTFASVVLERLTGWIVLPVLSLGALALNPGLRELGHSTALAVAIAVGTLVLLSLLLVTVAHPRLGGRLTGEEGWRNFAGAVHLGLDRFRRHPSAAVGVLLTGFAYQSAVVFAAFLAARALDLHHVGLTAVFAFFPAVAIAQVLPITIGGLGLREWSLVLFLDPLGVAAGQAVALGLLVYGLNLVVSLLGAPSFAVGGRPVRATT
jgi:uncharacterized membrane protein YbhN (UPF0104 family)